MIPPFGPTTILSPNACKSCKRPLRSPVAVLDSGSVLLQWTCRECGAVAVQDVGEVDYSRAELRGEVAWTPEERVRSDG